MSELTYMKTIDGIPIYSDPFMERDSFMVMYEKLWTPPWIIDTSFEPIKALEIEDIQKKKKDRKLSDVKGIICNSPEEDIEKIIQSLYKNFN